MRPASELVVTCAPSRDAATATTAATATERVKFIRLPGRERWTWLSPFPGGPRRQREDRVRRTTACPPRASANVPRPGSPREVLEASRDWLLTRRQGA